MPRIRLIARLDIKGPNLIKGVHLEGLRVVGDPNEHALRYYRAGIDELVFMDAVASLYGRNSLLDVVRRATEHIFVPITVGGGVRSVEDVARLLRAGADKVAVNTAAVGRPALIREIATEFGSQCIVAQIDAKAASDGWEVYTDGGREHTGRRVTEWVEEVGTLGAGEILLTSIDREGTRRGLDLALLRAVTRRAGPPVIASGGVGSAEHVVAAVRDGGADAVAIADALHYRRLDLAALRAAATAAGIELRPPS